MTDVSCWQPRRSSTSFFIPTRGAMAQASTHGGTHYSNVATTYIAKIVVRTLRTGAAWKILVAGRAKHIVDVVVELFSTQFVSSPDAEHTPAPSPCEEGTRAAAGAVTDIAPLYHRRCAPADRPKGGGNHPEFAVVVFIGIPPINAVSCAHQYFPGHQAW